MINMSAKIGVFIVASVSIAVTLVVVLSVLLAAPQTTLYPVSYSLEENGYIFWKDDRNGKTKLVIKSNLLQKNAKVLTSPQRNNDTLYSLSCKEARFQIERTIGNADSFQCYEITSFRGGLEDCSDHEDMAVEDCFMMTDENFDKIYWYGGPESYTQVWPLNEHSPSIFDQYTSTDVPWGYGNVLERYWLSSRGVFVFVPFDIPLHVSVHPGLEICLQSNYISNPRRGSTYSQDLFSHSTVLKYTVCVGDNINSVHEVALNNKFIKLPSQLPDLRMIKDPIWSTWARYKSEINQSTIENFADEIAEYGFSNSQLEIDDGYETAYGDFTFSETKFPDAAAMVQSLHEKGYRVTTWVTHFIGRQSIHFNEGVLGGYFITETGGSPNPIMVPWWNGAAAVIDFTNPVASEWYRSILQEVKNEYGVDSFKFDAGEAIYFPKQANPHQPIFNPCEYTTHYVESAFEVGGGIMEMRSAWKTQEYPIFTRIMDKGSRWGELNGLATLIPTALQFSVIGYPFIIPDMIGGNTYGPKEKPSREMFIRWMEVTAFMPVMQFSITPWDYDEEVVNITKNYVEIHQSFVYDAILAAASSYIKGTVVWLVSPIWILSDSSETDSFLIDDQFLVGDKYLVAPILKDGERSRDIYLPSGSNITDPHCWKDMLRSLNSDQEYIVKGGKWLYSYEIDLHEISWWELVSPCPNEQI